MSIRFGIHRTVPARLMAGVAAFCCASGCLFGGRPRAIITSNDPGSKIPAIKRAADARDTETARQLVKALQSEDPAVRFYSIRGLQNLTGETFGYVWYAEEPQRRIATLKWNQWLDDNDAGGLARGEHDRK
jgi:hypothetical protein